MGSRPLEPTLLLAWPTTEFGGMGLEGAVNIIHRKELEAIADADARAAFHREKTDALKRANTALSAAARFDVDDVIDPADTRRLLAQTLARLPQPPTAHRPQAPGRPVLGSVCGASLDSALFQHNPNCCIRFSSTALARTLVRKT
jgi:acetyl-CoA carboxylase carboxyltransferase component